MLDKDHKTNATILLFNQQYLLKVNKNLAPHENYSPYCILFFVVDLAATKINASTVTRVLAWKLLR